MDFYATVERRSVVAELPVKGRRTIYGALGDWFAWLCVLSLAAFVFIAVHRELRGGHHGKTS